MGFGSELQAQPSHTALLTLQDAELRLLESIKKCVTQRIKCDRDYATALANMINTAQKLDNSLDFNSPTFQAWNTVIKETENMIKLIRDNAEKLVAKTLEHLVQVINDKKAAKKVYNDEHLRLSSEFSKVEETVNKNRSDYEKLVSKVALDRAKFEDNFRKAKGGSKLDDCKQRYIKSETKLQRVHNDYVFSLHEATLHQKHFARTTLPGLLDFQQTTQQSLISQCKEILQDYSVFTDMTSDSFLVGQQNIHKSVSAIQSSMEYDDFLNKYRSDPLQIQKYNFDDHLLDDYKGSLLANEITLNDLTYESLQMSRSQHQDNLNNCQRRLENKTHELQQLEESVEQMGAEQLDEITRNNYNTKLKTIATLKREIIELQCAQERNQSLYDLVQAQFIALGDGDPPPGLEFPNYNEGMSSRDDLSAEGHPNESLAKKISDIRTQFAKHTIFRRSPNQPNSAPPAPPAKDFIHPAMATATPEPIAAQSNGQRPIDMPSPPVQDGYQQNSGEAERRLDEEEWFHGVLPREEVQKMLQEDGDYLVRESKNRKTGEMQYVLSVMWNGHKHFIIQGCEGNWKFEGDSFSTIQELIAAQEESNVPVTKKSEAIIKKPIMRSSWELRNNDIELCQKIGNGNFGEVYRGLYHPRNLEVAVKTCRETLSDEFKKKFLQEGQILMQYDHPNIVRFIGIAAQRQPVMIVMEYVPGGSLLNFLKKKGSKLQKKALVKMCEDAAAGMAYLEEKNCIHRDLAARNCLVDEKNNITKISDFGMSREDKEYTVSHGLKQIPIKWTAPEALNYGTYTSACDVWSFGILMWEVFAFGIIPYKDLSNSQAMERVDDGYRMPPPDGCPQAVYDLMLKCWDSEPKQRPKFSELHPELHRIRMASR